MVLETWVQQTLYVLIIQVLISRLLRGQMYYLKNSEAQNNIYAEPVVNYFKK